MGKLGLGDARQMLAMLNGDEVASSKLSHRIVHLLQQEGLLFAKTYGSRCKYRIDATLRESCRAFLAQQFGLKCSLEKFIELSSKTPSALKPSSSTAVSSLDSIPVAPSSFSDITASRAKMVEAVGDSKYHHIRSFRGFLVNNYTPIEATLNGHPFLIHPLKGGMTFISTPESFEIPKDTLVVGMENAENFMQIRKQKSLFDSLYSDQKILFVSRYPQNALSDLREWLLRISNHYVHFGDFDLAGVHIYLSEFYAYLGERSSFLMPEDIEERLKDGNARLYDQQYAKFKNLKVAADTRVQPLLDMIHRYCKGYEQEGYIGYAERN